MAGMVNRHIAALEALKGKKVEAGWFESAKYPSGIPVSVIARQNEFGATITVQPHEVTTYKSINEKTGNYNKQGKFVPKAKSNFSQTFTTSAYTIVIPARPFMRMAYADFTATRAALQKRLAKQLFEGKITPEQMLGQIGLYLEQCITSSIKSGDFAPNAARTIANKGFEKPLIHTSHMLQTVASKVY